MKRRIAAGLIAVALVTATACSRSAEEEKAQDAAAAVVKEGAGQVAEGAATIAQGLDQMAKSMAGAGKTEVLAFEKLGAAFPEVSGWKRGEVTGSTTSFPIAMSQSEATYESGDSRVELEVIDTALNQMLVAPFSMYLAANYSERSSDGYRKGTTIKGEPAFEEVSNSDKTGTITVVVGKRFIVHARGRDVAGIEPARTVLDKMDFSKLTAAK